MAATTAQIQQAIFTGCGVCGGSFCPHGICRVCSDCQACAVSEKTTGDDCRAEQHRLHEKAQQRRRDIELALAELASSNCPTCNRRKRKDQSFCKPSYTSLPKEIRSGLYLHVSSGYLEFWHRAKAFLEERAKGGRDASES